MRMRPFRKQPVSSAARRLFEIVGSTTSLEDAARLVASTYTNDLVRPPTDLHAIALRLNIQQICSEDLPVSGELRRNGKGFRLIYSSYLSPTQRRFTIAHEIGHAIFENSGPNCPRRGKELERICDMIAAELLMPEPLFLQLAGSEASAATVVELATSFQTSLAATGIRYAKLKGVSVFQVDHERVVWGSGVIRKGALRSLDYSIQTALSEITTKSGRSNIYHSHPLWTGEWKLSWESLGKQKVFVLYPA
jgi:hypothetical protein